MSNIKEQIRQEIYRLNDINKQIAKEQGCTDFIKGITAGYLEVLAFIDSLPDENNPEPYNPVYDEDYLNEKIAKATKSWERVNVDKMLAESRGIEEPSKDLEEAAEDCVWKSIDSNDPTLVPKFIPLLLSLFISGAYWQKEQMMKDAVEDALLLERAWFTLDGFGHEELAERLRKLKEKIC